MRRAPSIIPLCFAALAIGCQAERPMGADWSARDFLAQKGQRSAVRVVQLAAGSFHTCALRSDGRVLCWGANDEAQVGAAGDRSRVLPHLVADVESAVAISANGKRTCAVTSAGKVLCWGAGRATAYAIEGFSGPVASIALSRNHPCAMLRDGRVECWRVAFRAPDVERPSAIDLQGAKQIAAGDLHTCALVRDGSVECWGDNTLGQLGNGTTDPAPKTTEADVDGIVNVQAQGSGTCAWTWDGNLFCWGAIGAAHTSVPIGVPFTEGSRGGALAASAKKLCGWFESGRVRCVDEDKNLAWNESIHDAVQVVAGFAHFCALEKSGDVDCWGSNEFGQLGDDGDTRLEAVEVAPLSGALSIAADGATTCGLSRAGVECRGSGAAMLETTVPAFNADLAKFAATEVHLRNGVICLKNASSVGCGRLEDAKLGARTFTDESGKPLELARLDMSASQACVIASDRSAQCFDPASGSVVRRLTRGVPMLVDVSASTPAGLSQLGEVWTLAEQIPRIQQGPRAAVLAEGPYATCIAAKDGAVHCRTGPGPFAEVKGVRDATALAVSDGYACAIVKGGDVLCWGDDNAWGQLGDRTFEPHADAKPVTDVHGAKAIALGAAHACAQRENGTLLCWGWAPSKPGAPLGNVLSWHEQAQRVKGLIERTR